MENKTNMIPEEQLEAVSGGAGTRPAPRFEEGDYVKISTDPISGLIAERYYDKNREQWTYYLLYGFYHEDRWVNTATSGRYIPEDQLTPVGSTKSEFVTTLPDKTVIKTVIVE